MSELLIVILVATSIMVLTFSAAALVIMVRLRFTELEAHLPPSTSLLLLD